MTDITTKDIGKELDRDFGSNGHNEHIDRFYFHIRVKVTDQDLHNLNPLAILRDIDPDGNWRRVIPTEDWPGLFYGQCTKKQKFNAGQDETEREREQRLSEVRKTLMARLRKELASHSKGANDATEHGVYVMITHACLYTPEDMDTA